ncbi:hypothetical protein BP6252_10201 [Coleophoma cylindrospora]|uniref:Uncharacterized protein n=1 Tax=Coleophoma cylindrospora TaxID=1849047 RepID=A0A3D8QXQ0_9HELO|nr:hypothetical protein BP6252_10201 [Coleophoma cylindrospora]
MRSQEAAFKASRKPAKKPKQVVEQPRAATPQKIVKNASRNERRKAARRVASLLRAQKALEEPVSSEAPVDEPEPEAKDA